MTDFTILPFAVRDQPSLGLPMLELGRIRGGSAADAPPGSVPAPTLAALALELAGLAVRVHELEAWQRREQARQAQQAQSRGLSWRRLWQRLRAVVARGPGRRV